jgi:hypothetical protein
MRLPAAVLLCSLISTVAQAQAPLAPAQRDSERRAQSLFAAGRYEEAVAVYADLWAGNHDPIYLRNIGRCYQKLRNPERAIGSFEEYLAKARHLSPGERREIEGYLREMQALKEEQESARQREAAAAQPPPPPPEKARPPVAPSLPEEPPAVVRRTEPIPPPPADQRAPVWRRAGLIGLGVAGALATGGGVAMWSSWSKWSDANNRCPTKGDCSAAADSIDARTLVSRLLFVGAGVVAVTSGLLIYLHPIGGAGQVQGLVVGGARAF